MFGSIFFCTSVSFAVALLSTLFTFKFSGVGLVNLLVGEGGELFSVINKKLVWFNGFF